MVFIKIIVRVKNFGVNFAVRICRVLVAGKWSRVDLEKMGLSFS